MTAASACPTTPLNVAGSDEGGRRAAAIYTLIATAKLNDTGSPSLARRRARPLARSPGQAHPRSTALELAAASRRSRSRLSKLVRWSLLPQSVAFTGCLHSMRALDREIDDLNRRRPDWSVAGLPYSTPAFTMDLKIPDPYKNGKLLWPPPQPNLALQYLASMPPDTFIISEAAKGRYIEESRRRMLDDNQRIAEAAQRQREHEEREAAEARKAQEAERAAYYAKHGWPR